MDNNSIELLVGSRVADFQNQIKPQQDSVLTAERSRRAETESPEKNQVSFVSELDDPASPEVQKSTLKMVESLLKLHHIGLQASLRHQGNEAYIELNDMENGERIKRMKVEDVMRILSGDSRMLDDAV